MMYILVPDVLMCLIGLALHSPLHQILDRFKRNSGAEFVGVGRIVSFGVGEAFTLGGVKRALVTAITGQLLFLHNISGVDPTR